MSKQAWLDYYNQFYSEFEWFIPKDIRVSLQKAQEEDNILRMLNLMNHVWFILPDNQFNIIENPKGWNHFLFLLEELPEIN